MKTCALVAFILKEMKICAEICQKYHFFEVSVWYRYRYRFGRYFSSIGIGSADTKIRGSVNH